MDFCSSCKGIWLDRGELEKLIARASREYDEGPPSSDDRRRHAPHAGEHHRGEHHPKRKRGWLESIGDIFD